MAKLRILALVILCAASVLAAQEPVKTNLVLTVTDPSGAVIPNATTHVESSDHSISFGTKTDNVGQVSFELMPGSYTIKVNAMGFQRWVTQTQINSAPTQEIKAVLRLGSPACTVPCDGMFPTPPIYTEEISITSLIPYVELTPFPLHDKKLQGGHFKLLPCLVSISCSS